MPVYVYCKTCATMDLYFRNVADSCDTCYDIQMHFQSSDVSLLNDVSCQYLTTYFK